jgi:hypothetical protein
MSAESKTTKPSRKVWLLDAELNQRLQAFQAAHKITSEVEAARRLLEFALQSHDTAEDILRRIKGRHDTGVNIRAIAADVLATHPRVTSIQFIGTGALTFELGAGRSHSFPETVNGN